MARVERGAFGQELTLEERIKIQARKAWNVKRASKLAWSLYRVKRQYRTA